jgi:serine/threonine protein phosphatase 1
LWALLREIEFAPKRDRLFSVGDLIDRGPDSSRCLRLLNRSGFYSVLGNHDVAFVVNIASGRGVDAATRHVCAMVGQQAGHWYMDHDRRDLLPLAIKLNRRPHIITVGDKKPAFHIVHASLIPFAREKPIFLSNAGLGLYDTSQDPETLVFSLTGERRLWSGVFSQRVEELASVYCGHSVVSRPRWSLGHLNLDTGAGLHDTSTEERQLTIACHQTKEIWSVVVSQPQKIVRYFIPKSRRVR